jgi:hypothetical protein
MTLDRPTISERYARATESSHLEMVADRIGDIDVLTASGWISDGLGTSLYRLRAEWDAVRAEQRQAEAQLRYSAAAARKLGEMHREAAQRAAEDAALTARALILVRLGTLAHTRDALGRFADVWATRRRYMKPYAVVAKIAGRALDVWLDPQCPVCTGRMFVGELGGPQAICKACGGTGKRPYTLHETSAGHEFGRSLLAEMDRKTDKVDKRLKAYLSQYGKPPRPDEAIAALREQLDRLRSVEAQED